MWSARSWTRTDHPRWASAAAATSPATPPPAISACPAAAIVERADRLLLLRRPQHHGRRRLVRGRLPVADGAAHAVDVHAVPQEEPRRLVVREAARLAVDAAPLPRVHRRP